MYWTAMATSTVTQDIVTGSFAWWDRVQKENGSVANHGYLLFELFSCRDNLTSRASSAWPRPLGYRHMVLIGGGCDPDAPKTDRDTAKDLVKEDGPQMILGPEGAKTMMPIPNALEDFHDKKLIYGGHYEKLRDIKKKYDPEDRMGGWIRP
jgi:hypothetical protein